MKSDLEADNHRLPDEDLIKDLVDVAQKLNQNTVTKSEYNKHGKYTEGAIRKSFGSWINALEKAGLSASRDCFVTDDRT